MTISILLGQLSFSVAATAQDVAGNYDQSVGFPKFKSHKWVAIMEGVHPDQLVDQQIKAALDAELAKRWLKNTDSEQADKYIGYQPGIGQELRRPVRLRNVHYDGIVSGLEEWNS